LGINKEERRDTLTKFELIWVEEHLITTNIRLVTSQTK
jgi:hypothetical protein